MVCAGAGDLPVKFQGLDARYDSLFAVIMVSGVLLDLIVLDFFMC